MLTLPEIKRKIDKKLEELDDPKNQTMSKTDKKNLGMALELLRQYFDNKEVKNALIFLQQLPIKGSGFFSNFRLENSLSKDKKIKMENVKSGVQTNPIPSNQSAFLIEIHQDLMGVYNPQNPEWQFSYPLDRSGQVMNETIRKWQKGMQELSPQKSIVDFTRGFTIENQEARTEEELRKQLRQLLEKTDYTPEQKKILEEWFLHNAGQAMHTYLTDSIAQFHIIGEQNPEDEIDTPGARFHLIKAGWYVQNKKLYFDDVLAVKVITLKYGNEFIAGDKNNQINSFTRKSDNESYEKIEDMKKDDIVNLPTVLGAKGTMFIDFDRDNKVTPKIIFNEVSSYTNLLHPPTPEQATLIDDRKEDISSTARLGK